MSCESDVQDAVPSPAVEWGDGGEDYECEV